MNVASRQREWSSSELLRVAVEDVGYCGFVPITATSTLMQVRSLIRSSLTALPGARDRADAAVVGAPAVMAAAASTPDVDAQDDGTTVMAPHHFRFVMPGGVPVGRRQEDRLRAADYLPCVFLRPTGIGGTSGVGRVTIQANIPGLAAGDDAVPQGDGGAAGAAGKGGDAGTPARGGRRGSYGSAAHELRVWAPASVTFGDLRADAAKNWGVPVEETVLSDPAGVVFPDSALVCDVRRDPRRAAEPLLLGLLPGSVLELRAEAAAGSVTGGSRRGSGDTAGDAGADGGAVAARDAVPVSPHDGDGASPAVKSRAAVGGAPPNFAELEPELWRVFTYYCVVGDHLDVEYMNARGFKRLLQDSKLLDVHIDAAEVDVIYSSEVTKGRPDAAANGKMTYDEFLAALMAVAARPLLKDKALMPAHGSYVGSAAQGIELDAPRPGVETSAAVVAIAPHADSTAVAAALAMSVERAFFDMVVSNILPHAARWPKGEWEEETRLVSEDATVDAMYAFREALREIFRFYVTSDSTPLRMRWWDFGRLVRDLAFDRLNIGAKDMARVFLVAAFDDAEAFADSESESDDDDGDDSAGDGDGDGGEAKAKAAADAGSQAASSGSRLSAGRSVRSALMAARDKLVVPAQRLYLTFPKFLSVLCRIAYKMHPSSSTLPAATRVKSLLQVLSRTLTRSKVMDILALRRNMCSYPAGLMAGTRLLHDRMFEQWQSDGFAQYSHGDKGDVDPETGLARRPEARGPGHVRSGTGKFGVVQGLDGAAATTGDAISRGLQMVSGRGPGGAKFAWPQLYEQEAAEASAMRAINGGGVDIGSDGNDDDDESSSIGADVGIDRAGVAAAERARASRLQRGRGLHRSGATSASPSPASRGASGPGKSRSASASGRGPAASTGGRAGSAKPAHRMRSTTPSRRSVVSDASPSRSQVAQREQDLQRELESLLELSRSVDGSRMRRRLVPQGTGWDSLKRLESRDGFEWRRYDGGNGRGVGGDDGATGFEAAPQRRAGGRDSRAPRRPAAASGVSSHDSPVLASGIGASIDSGEPRDGGALTTAALSTSASFTSAAPLPSGTSVRAAAPPQPPQAGATMDASAAAIAAMPHRTTSANDWRLLARSIAPPAAPTQSSTAISALASPPPSPSPSPRGRDGVPPTAPDAVAADDSVSAPASASADSGSANDGSAHDAASSNGTSGGRGDGGGAGGNAGAAAPRTDDGDGGGYSDADEDPGDVIDATGPMAAGGGPPSPRADGKRGAALAAGSTSAAAAPVPNTPGWDGDESASASIMRDGALANEGGTVLGVSASGSQDLALSPIGQRVGDTSTFSAVSDADTSALAAASPRHHASAGATTGAGAGAGVAGLGDGGEDGGTSAAAAGTKSLAIQDSVTTPGTVGKGKGNNGKGTAGDAARAPAVGMSAMVELAVGRAALGGRLGTDVGGGGDASATAASADNGDLEAQLAAVLPLLKKGAVFTKHGTSRLSSPHPRWVGIDDAVTRVQWRANTKPSGGGKRRRNKTEHIAIATVKEVVKGAVTPVLRRSAKLSEGLLFSLVATDRSLDLEAQNEAQRDEWFDAFALLVRAKGADAAEAGADGGEA